jgi:hypothetical protein
MNVAFEITAVADADGAWEIVSVECEPTSEVADDELEACEVDQGSREFRFILPADFDGSEAVLARFPRYGLSSELVYEACQDAMASSKDAIEP